MIDPLGRLATMMEKLTQDLADAAWAIIEEVEAMGGMTKAVESRLAQAADRGVRRARSRRASTAART